jgi:hypothetical protein
LQAGVVGQQPFQCGAEARVAGTGDVQQDAALLGRQIDGLVEQ